MFGKILLAIVIPILFCPSPPAVVLAQSSHSGYAPVNGLKMYYEIHGTANDKNLPLVKRADWQVSMIEAFLDAPMPKSN